MNHFYIYFSAGDHVRKLLLQNKINELSTEYMLKYRTNNDVINGIAFLRRNMPKDVISQPSPYPAILDIKVVIENEHSDSDDSDSSKSINNN